MINPKHFRELIVRPTLEALGAWSQSAEELVIGTAAHESLLYHLKQLGGPALGVYQIEPATHKDVWDNYLAYREDMASKVRGMASQHLADLDDELVGNLHYATAICRLIYYRRPEPLPAADDVVGLAQYWKAHYNTHLGKGRIDDWIDHYSEVA